MLVTISFINAKGVTVLLLNGYPQISAFFKIPLLNNSVELQMYLLTNHVRYTLNNVVYALGNLNTSNVNNTLDITYNELV